MADQHPVRDAANADPPNCARPASGSPALPTAEDLPGEPRPWPLPIDAILAICAYAVLIVGGLWYWMA